MFPKLRFRTIFVSNRKHNNSDPKPIAIFRNLESLFSSKSYNRDPLLLPKLRFRTILFRTENTITATLNIHNIHIFAIRCCDRCGVVMVPHIIIDISSLPRPLLLPLTLPLLRPSCPALSRLPIIHQRRYSRQLATQPSQ